MNQKKPLIILTGPTAVGKSNLAIALAEKIGGEIISADSCQVYKYMNIGSAKITTAEMKGIPHHLINVLEPTEAFNVVIFQQMVKQCLEGIYERNHIPIMVGGTGFYIQSVLYGIDFTDNEENHEIRNQLEALLLQEGNEHLHQMLWEIDPESATKIHANNSKRVMRAIEFYQLTGIKISTHNEKEKEKESLYDSYYFVLTDKRETLYERINQRVDIMIEDGLIAEVQHLRKMGCGRELVSMQALGYKEILAYLDDEIGLLEAIEIIKRDTRHFAKRQLTWFRREKNVLWLPKEDFQYNDEAILTHLLENLNFNIIKKQS